MAPDDQLCRDFLLAQNVDPLFAVVSGAHLYGFESPDSDIDLRGVFCLPLRSVLGLRSPEETLTVNSPPEAAVEMDFVAHDVAKFCRLLTRNNGYVLEQIYSPLVVVGGQWLDELKVLARGCCTRNVHHHYRGFLHTQLKLLAREGATVKELLYAYRVVLTGIHYLRSGEIESHLPTLLATRQASSISDLIARKREGAEQQLLREGEWATHEARLSQLENEMTAAHLACTLPEAVVNYEDVSDFVVRVRMSSLAAHR